MALGRSRRRLQTGSRWLRPARLRGRDRTPWTSTDAGPAIKRARALAPVSTFTPIQP
ncbi:hypothetical protein GLE_0420 [Lysobacter enzymogenes]|uniref:Uncharacterized protein n=1 Tax=Lysobacter enzymogenes TaxID=69 RepID=A0A0S2DB63_LYSEN|nr:hypothetical protein GLE_0420 [Lysobacter enzymogenes]